MYSIFVMFDLADTNMESSFKKKQNRKADLYELKVITCVFPAPSSGGFMHTDSENKRAGD